MPIWLVLTPIEIEISPAHVERAVEGPGGVENAGGRIVLSYHQGNAGSQDARLFAPNALPVIPEIGLMIEIHEAGVDGVLMVNLPPEEAADLKRELERFDISLIFLVAPTTTRGRAKLIAGQASGFIYYVTLKGVTGASHAVVDDVMRRIEPLRGLSDLPILVGFGIKSAQSASDFAIAADGVVVGSVLVDIMGAHAGSEEAIFPELAKCVGAMRVAMDANT